MSIETGETGNEFRYIFMLHKRVHKDYSANGKWKDFVDSGQDNVRCKEIRCFGTRLIVVVRGRRANGVDVCGLRSRVVKSS